MHLNSYYFYTLLGCVIVMGYPLKGTFEDLMEVVPTKALSMMASQDRCNNYIFNIDVQNGFLLVW